MHLPSLFGLRAIAMLESKGVARCVARLDRRKGALPRKTIIEIERANEL